MTKRLTLAGTALALALLVPQQAEAQTRTVCLTANQNTCVTFSGISWVNGAGGHTYTSTFQFFGTGTVPNLVSFWWNQGNSDGGSNQLGWYTGGGGETAAWQSGGSWNSGQISLGGGSPFWQYPPVGGSFTNYDAFTGTSGGPDPMDVGVNTTAVTMVQDPTDPNSDIANGMSLFEVVYFNPDGSTTNDPCTVSAPITYVAPDGTEVAVQHAGFFAMLFQTPQDCVSIQNGVVPEPGTLLLLSTGLLGLGVAARRRTLDDEFEDEAVF